MPRRGAPRRRVELFVIRAVAVDDGDPARLQACEYLGLGVGDRLDGGKELEVDRCHRRDDCDVRAHHGCEGQDLAGVVHADLGDREAGRLRHAGEGEGHPPVVVVGRHRRVDRAGRRQSQAQRLLGGGLADRAGDGDDARGRAGARGAAEVGHRGQHVPDDVEWAVAGAGVDVGLVDDRRRRTRREGLADVIVAVGPIAGDREEEVARFECPRVDRHAAYPSRRPAGHPRAQRRDEAEARPPRIGGGVHGEAVMVGR